MLRAFRKSGLRETAAKIPINFSHLSKWERGERQVPTELVPAYGANGTLITRDRLHTAAEAARLTGPAPVSGGGGYAHHARRLLATLVPGSTATGKVLAAVEDLTGGLRAALADRDGIDPDAWERLAWERGLAYHTHPPETLLPMLIIDQGRLSHLLGRSPASATTHAALLSIAARLTALLALTLGDLGQLAAASACWELARAAADSSADPTLRVWVRGQHACQGYWTGQPAASLSRLITDATTLAADTPTPGLALAHAACAHLLADRGDADGARTALDDFQHITSQLSPDPVDALTPWGLPLHTRSAYLVYPYLLLDDIQRASQVLTDAEALCPPDFPAHAAFVCLLRAHLMILQGETGKGVELATAQGRPLNAACRGILARLLATLPYEARTHPAAQTLRDLITPTP